MSPAAVSHVSLRDKVGEALGRTPCPHPAGARGQRMSVSIPPANGNSWSPPRAVIVPCPTARGVLSLFGLRSHFPALPFDLVSHGPGAGLPQRRNSRLRDGVMSFFQRTCRPGWQWKRAFFSADAAAPPREGRSWSKSAVGMLQKLRVTGKIWDPAQAQESNLVFLCLLTPQWECENSRACHKALSARSALAEKSV